VIILNSLFWTYVGQHPLSKLYLKLFHSCQTKYILHPVLHCPSSCIINHAVITFSGFGRIGILTPCVFRFLQGASNFATNLCVFKLSTCKELIWQVTFLWHFKNLVPLTHIWFHSITTCSFFGGPQNAKNKTKSV